MSQNLENKHSVEILCDRLSSTDLKELFDEHSNDIAFKLIANNQVTRSPFSDPTVLAALIGAGATTVASLITLIGVIWNTRKKEGKAEDDAVIEIKITKKALEQILKRQNDASKQVQIQEILMEGKQLINTLQIPINEAAALEGDQNRYHLILNELLAGEVEHVAILEDN